MRKSPLAAFCFLALALAAHSVLAARMVNDDFYPSAPSAKPFIDFDNKGFIINGHHTYLASGSIHYPRVPHELWEDRLTRLKNASFNGVQTYAFWNYHEPVQGQWNFSGDADFGAYLDTAQKVGLFATVRPGPYVCAEWDSGGYPVWARFVPNLGDVRTADPVWLSLNDHWYDKILPIIAQHQINHGGNVILVQLENENPKGWGVWPNNPYFAHLHDVAVKDGIEVPHFMSGMHHGRAPSPADIDPTKRTTPWYSTEFWSGWFDEYRVMPAKKFASIVAANWAIMAHGGAGQNYYMIHGGTNFASWSDFSTGASYDYGAPIGQTGDLRPLYYQLKRANQLAQSFPDIIGNSTSALTQYQDFATGPDVEVNGARQSDAGTIVFLANRGPRDTVATLKTGETLHMPPGSNYAFPHRATIAPAVPVQITDTTLPVLAVAHNDHSVTVIVYGQSGDSGTLKLTGGKHEGDLLDLDGSNTGDLKIQIPASGITEQYFHQPDYEIRVLAISDALSLYTWIVGPADKQDVIIGPAYVQAVEHADNKTASVILERPYGQPSCGQVAVYGAKDREWHLAVPADTTLDSQLAPRLGNWQMIPLTQAAPNYDDSTWKASDNPPEMGSDGDTSAFAWYRAAINLPSAGDGILKFKAVNNAQVFVNGQLANEGKIGFDAHFLAGKNTIAIFTSSRGRKDAYDYLGKLDAYDPKGIITPVTLSIGDQYLPITNWKLKGGLGADPSSLTSWTPPAPSQGMPAFYQTTFTTTPPAPLGAHPILRINFKGLSRGMYWVNGHALGRYPEKIPVDSLYIPECWLKPGENVLTVFDETGALPDQIQLVVEHPSSREVIRAAQSTDASTPIVVPTEPR
jgi:beta-galactosidase